MSYNQQNQQGPGQYGAPPPPQGYGGQPAYSNQYGQQQGGYGQQQQRPQNSYGAPSGPPPPNQPYGSQPQQQQQQQQVATYGSAPPPQQSYGQQQQPQGLGFNRPGPPTMPPGADPQLWAWYQSVDTDRSGQIDVKELQNALINGDWSPFSLEAVQMMMQLFDRDNSGTIGFEEFVGLWRYIEDWKRIFQQFDADRSGRIDRFELKSALLAFGYQISERIVDTIIRKFGRKGASEATFDQFIIACCLIKSLSEAFQRVDTDRDGWGK
ncbi:hypothetical protein HKX48_006555 [Thoreauomyces humboldtii]|nr:hypothetical protein HKX48_006555 [Thoreauomyces humboldtii]